MNEAMWEARNEMVVRPKLGHRKEMNRQTHAEPQERDERVGSTTEAEPQERDEGVDSCRATRKEASSHGAMRCSKGHRRLKGGGTRQHSGASIRPKPMPMGTTKGEQGVKRNEVRWPG